MKTSSARLCLVAGLAVLAIAGLGCGAGGAPRPGAETSDDRDRLEVACEVALIRLEKLIAERSDEHDFPAPRLLEARELYALGRELYLEREYDLALEFLEDGITLVDKKS
jgi:hypothetical protein